MKQIKRDNFFAILFGILLAYVTYVFVLNELPKPLADFNGHTYVYLPMFNKETWVKGWMAAPYCMWHLTVLFFNKIFLIPLEISAAYSTCIFTLFAYFVLYWMIQKMTAAAGSAESPAKCAVTAFGLCLVQPLYFGWLDAGGRFLGSYSMNPLHNPTQMCARGFSLVCLCLVYDIFGRQKDENYHGIFFHVENGLKKYYICLALALFLSAMAKPTFAEMFIPTVALLMLGEWITRLVHRQDGTAAYFKKCLTMLLCAVPALLYILIQFLAYFIWGGSYGDDGSLIVTKLFEVWNMYTENVGLSVLTGMAFPLFMLAINSRYFLKDDLGRLALTGYCVGFLEAAFLGESGQKLSYSNFLWPMMSGMLLMWVVSVLRLLVLEKAQADSRKKRILLNAAWALFFIHVLYGLLYIKDMLEEVY